MVEDRFNGRLKRYPDGRWELLVCNRAIFSGAGDEEAPPPKKKGRGEKHGQPMPKPADRAAANLERSQRRARGRIRDLALCSELDWFVTFTLDAAKIDRYDIGNLTKKMRVWLDNRVRRKGLAYILVPELHRDGAIHLHGLFNDALRMVDSGVKHSRQVEGGTEWYPVYNVPDWGLGFSSAIRLYGQREKAVNYVCKYINKAGDNGRIGGRWYYAGGELKEPDFSYCMMDYNMIHHSCYDFAVKEAGLEFKLIRGSDGGPDI